MNDEERRQWIMNDEGLYNWWRQSRLSLKQFICQNRAEITEAIEPVLNNKKPAHYLAYGPEAKYSC